MKKNAYLIVLTGMLLLSISFILSSCGTTPTAALPPTDIPAATLADTLAAPTEPPVLVTEPPVVLDGQVLMNARCSDCHAVSRVTNSSHSMEEWTVIVDRMIAKGAELNTGERQVLIDYLAQNYPE